MNTQEQLLLAGPRISRLTIARLFNLGSYEHVRYEVTVELPPGTSPASVMTELDATMADVDPKPPVSTWGLYEAQNLLSKPAPEAPAASPDDDDDPFSESPIARHHRLLEKREEAKRDIERYEAWRQRRDAALAKLDQFGGTRTYSQPKDSEETDL